MTRKELLIKAKLSSNDIFIFQITYLIRQWYVWLLILTFLISIGNIAYRLSVGELSEVPPQSWFFSLVMLFFLFLLISSSKKSAKNKIVNEEKTYRISEEYFMMETESTTQRVFWSDFVKYILTERFVYLFVSNNSAHLVPLNALSNDEKNFLIQIIQSRLKTQQKSSFSTVVICLVLLLLTVGFIQYFN
ncbi:MULTISPECIES: YcxB family protein [Paenibacillus]|uniref:YcxB-like C-terminal domain-containing protein n=1 Tax=Paenibacillus albilobatus TaxID=2716884 RepID=A0A919XJ85_9BACL|nr:MULTISPECIES: YcxB family protein [Paenibacillus]GIO31747.1 hypothetical protein J2TS6_28880 [Paenibacillus albilobatus]